ncbi:MAG: rhomboid family intramembrane serine protease [Bacteroidetes bacterium]|nr:rhomboid family intramembrane serine protease [Bacteroidota bacterium]
MIVWIIIATTSLISWQAFTNRNLFERYVFNPDRILRGGEWIRLIGSGFLHVNTMHLIFNMYAFYSFSWLLLAEMGEVGLAVIYFGSMVVGGLLSLLIHKNNSHYRAVGASGAVSGVVYSSILLYPNGGIGIILLPGSIDSWIFGLLFMAFSIYGIRSNRDNIGHEAHLGGAIAGVLITVIWFWGQGRIESWIIWTMLVPTVAFLLLLRYKPEWILPKTKSGFQVQMPTKFQGKRPPLSENRQRELDRLLEKVNRVGINGLSIGERQRLEDLRKYMDE